MELDAKHKTSLFSFLADTFGGAADDLLDYIILLDKRSVSYEDATSEVKKAYASCNCRIPSLFIILCMPGSLPCTLMRESLPDSEF